MSEFLETEEIVSIYIDGKYVDRKRKVLLKLENVVLVEEEDYGCRVFDMHPNAQWPSEHKITLPFSIVRDYLTNKHL